MDVKHSDKTDSRLCSGTIAYKRYGVQNTYMQDYYYDTYGVFTLYDVYDGLTNQQITGTVAVESGGYTLMTVSFAERWETLFEWPDNPLPENQWNEFLGSYHRKMEWCYITDPSVTIDGHTGISYDKRCHLDATIVCHDIVTGNLIGTYSIDSITHYDENSLNKMRTVWEGFNAIIDWSVEIESAFEKWVAYNPIGSGGTEIHSAYTDDRDPFGLPPGELEIYYKPQTYTMKFVLGGVEHTHSGTYAANTYRYGLGEFAVTLYGSSDQYFVWEQGLTTVATAQMVWNGDTSVIDASDVVKDSHGKLTISGGAVALVCDIPDANTYSYTATYRATCPKHSVSFDFDCLDLDGGSQAAGGAFVVGSDTISVSANGTPGTHDVGGKWYAGFDAEHCVESNDTGGPAGELYALHSTGSISNIAALNQPDFGLDTASAPAWTAYSDKRLEMSRGDVLGWGNAITLTVDSSVVRNADEAKRSFVVQIFNSFVGDTTGHSRTIDEPALTDTPETGDVGERCRNRIGQIWIDGKEAGNLYGVEHQQIPGSPTMIWEHFAIGLEDAEFSPDGKVDVTINNTLPWQSGREAAWLAEGTYTSTDGLSVSIPWQPVVKRWRVPFGELIGSQYAVKKYMAGQIRCLARNDDGSAADTVTLKQYKAPDSTTPIMTTDLTPGADGVVITDSLPQATSRWFTITGATGSTITVTGLGSDYTGYDVFIPRYDGTNELTPVMLRITNHNTGTGVLTLASAPTSVKIGARGVVHIPYRYTLTVGSSTQELTLRNRGVTFAQFLAGVVGCISSIYSNNSGRLYVGVIDAGAIAIHIYDHTSNSATTRSTSISANHFGLGSLQASKGGIIIAYESDGTIYRRISNDECKTWSEAVSIATGTSPDVAYNPDDQVEILAYISGSNLYVRRKLGTGAYGDAISVCAASESDTVAIEPLEHTAVGAWIIVHQSGSTLNRYKSTDSGKTWALDS